MTEYELEYVEIKNYRQYADVQKFDLRTKGEKRINIIQGQNGAGKSNFLNALSLCLYGEELHGSEQEKHGESDLRSLPIANVKAFSNLEAGESVSGYVEVCFSRGTSKFAFRREFETYLNDGEDFTNSIEELTMTKLTGDGWVEVSNPNTVLNQIIPQDIKDYYFFDGEDLDELFKEEHYREIREGILQISQIDLLDRVLYHLSEVRDDLQKDAKDLGGSTAEVRAELDDLEEIMAEKEDLKSDLEGEIETAEQEIEEIDDKLEDATNERVIELRSKRESLEDQLEEAEDTLSDLRDEAGELIFDLGPSVLSYSALETCESKLEKIATTQGVPLGTTDTLIDTLVERGTCICGEDLDDHPERVDHLKELREELSELDAVYKDGQSVLSQMKTEASIRIDDVVEVREDIRAVEDEISSLQFELEDISNELKNYDIPDVDVEALESQRAELREEISAASKRIGSIESDIDDLESQISDKEQKLEKEKRKDDRKSRVDVKIDFVERASDILEGIRSHIIEDIRAEAEAKMEEYYNDLIWKADHFEIQLNEDYSVEVHTEGNSNNLVGSLSAGERQVLALAYMSSIANVSGYNAPTVIDTPLGRISSRPRKRIAQNFPDYLEGNQITFLMTDEEYTTKVESILKDHVANEYRLEYSNGTTEVVTNG